MTLGDVFILALALLILAWILSYRSISPRVRTLLAAGLVLRIVGGQLYYLVGEVVYGGTADYWTYFRHGTMYAQALLAGTPEASGSLWLERGEWCCTAFTIKTSGIVIAGLEPSVLGLFVLFSLIGFGGIVAFAMAFQRAFPAIHPERYLFWLVVFPSLWYWPAALGKDALVMAGIGMAVLGFVGRRNRVNVFVLAAGTALVFAVRPQVAVVLLFSIVAGYWLFTMRRVSVSRVAQGALVAIIGVGVLFAAQNTLGLTLVDAGDAEEYLTGTQAAVARMEGSSVTSGGNPLFGFINVMMRPFLWEARSVTSLIGGLEIAALWVIGWRRRAEVKGFIRAYRGHRVFWMAVVFIVAYAAALGMAAGNMGVIARQRIHVFPFVFMFFAGVPSHRRTTPGTPPVPRRASRSVVSI